MNVWAASLVCALLLFQLVAVPALVLRKNDLADVLWGPAFPLAALAGAAFARPEGLAHLGARATLVLALVSLWALRLGWHVGSRNLGHREEDPRYAKWRREWGSTQVWRSWLQVWVLQPLILWVFLTPVLLALASPPAPAFTLPAIAGLAVWLTGFLFEAIGDEQLRRFKRDPANRGRLMTGGLWSWTRHPNYFGEVTLWWGIWLLVSDLPGALPCLAGPLGVTYLIARVSGVTMLEEHMRPRAGYAEYVRATSSFFPRPPRRP